MRILKLTLACICLIVQAQGQALTEKIPLNPKVLYGTLPNGLKYYIQQNKKPENKVELRLAVNAGSILEDPDQQGLAHFMEHMNFNGLKNFPHNDLVHYLQSIGVEFGADLNAYTGFDETVYILPVPSDDREKLEKAFTIIADWSGNALLTPDEIDAERGVVLEESRLGKGADDRMMQKWLPKLMNNSKYAQRLPIGKDDILKNFKYDVLRRFHKDWYRPNLQAVCVVGDIDPQNALELIKKNFSNFKNPPKPRPRPAKITIPARVKSESLVLSDPEAAYTMIMLSGDNVPAAEEKVGSDYRKYLAKQMFNYLLNQRLEEYKSKPEPPFVFAGGGIESGWARGYENFMINSICGGNEIDKAINTIVTECMRVKKYGFTQAELARAKQSVMSNYEKAYNERNKTESSRIVMEYVSHYLSGEPAPGIEWEYQFAKNYLDGISLSEVNALGKRVDIDKKYFCTVTTRKDATAGQNIPTSTQVTSLINKALKAPVSAYEEKTIATKLLANAPTPGTIVKTETNKKLGTTTFTLSNGAEVTLKPTNFKDDEILLTAYRMGGSSLYLGNDYQSADFANNIVEEMGYGEFTASDLDKFMTGKQVKVNTIIDKYNENIQASSSKKDLKTMFELLYLKCTDPKWDQVGFNAFIKRSKQELENLRQEPMNAFADSMSICVNQYHERAGELPKMSDYDAMTPKNAISFYKDRFSSANGFKYFIVGSFDVNEIKPLIEQYIGGLGGQKVITEFRDLKMNPKPGNNSYTMRKGTEPKAMIGHQIYLDTKYDADDNFGLSQLAEIINNKITDNLREKMSVIYSGGIGGGITKYPTERFTAQTFLPCGPENIEKADKAFWDIISEVSRDGGISEDDWNKAKQTAIQKNKIRLQNNNFWANALMQSSMNGVDPERLLTVEERLNKINPDVLVKLAKKYYGKANVYKGFLLPLN